MSSNDIATEISAWIVIIGVILLAVHSCAPSPDNYRPKPAISHHTGTVQS